MKIRDIYNAKAVALRQTEVASNKLDYLGRVFFPIKKKMGLDLKWIKTSKGLPVTLAPSNFDAKSTLRSREGITLTKTQMAFFRESMLVSEEDEQEIMRVQESTDPYAQAVIDHVYSDGDTLVESARVVGERMIWQLLNPASGSPAISIQANGVTYAYSYDASGAWATTNYTSLSGTSVWTDTANADPISDVRTGIDAVEDATGETPTIAVVNRNTMSYLIQNAKIKAAIQGLNTGIIVNEARVKALFHEELGINLVVYNKKYKNAAGNAVSFCTNGYCTLLPERPVGNLYFGTTPEERTLMGDAAADVALVDEGIAIAVTTTNDPVNTKTTVSEIVLPSFEGMDSVYVIKAY